jgi:hypothetical protein
LAGRVKPRAPQSCSRQPPRKTLQREPGACGMLMIERCALRDHADQNAPKSGF